jgi:hypothetical protein
VTSDRNDQPWRGQPFAGRAWWWNGSLLCLAIAIGLYLLAPTEADPDLWGHVRFGLDLLDSGQVVRGDVYSYLTGDQLWVNHEWLSEAIMAIAFRGAGAAGLIALKVAIGLAVAGLLVWHLNGVLGARNRLLAALLMTAYGVAVILPGVRSLRPQAFTYLLFLIVLLLVHRAERGRGRMLWVAVPLFAVWANLHGGFVAGLGVLIVWLVTRMLTSRDWRPAAAGAVVVVAAGAATLVNPYGVGLWMFLARTLGPRPDIAEWQAVPLASAEGVAYLAVLAFGAIGAMRALRERRWTAAILFACGAVLPFVARRHLPLFVLITLVFCAEHVYGPRLSSMPTRGSRGADRFRPLVASALLIEAIVLIALTLPHLARIRVNPAEFPVAATTRLARSGVAGNLAVDFDWGEYVLWHVGPRVKVSVDGRRETVYSDAAYEENVQFTNGAGQWDRLLTQHSTDLALISTRARVFSLLSQRPDWELLMEDASSGSALFGRRGAAVTARVRATPVSAIDPRVASVFP